MLGMLFEKWFIHAVMTGKRNVKCTPLSGFKQAGGNQAVEFPEILDIRMFEQQPTKNLHGYSVLYQPTSFNHAYWDLIIHKPPEPESPKHLLIFLQISVQTVRQHDSSNKKYRIESSFKHEGLLEPDW